MGDLSAVEARCQFLMENQPMCAKFAGQLMEWASAFEEGEIIRMIEAALQLANGTNGNDDPPFEERKPT